jgi:hypothetical protein
LPPDSGPTAGTTPPPAQGAAATPEADAGVTYRGLTTAAIVRARVMQGLNTTIVNVPLPYMRRSLSATQDQISWIDPDVLHRGVGHRDAAHRLAWLSFRDQANLSRLGDRFEHDESAPPPQFSAKRSDAPKQTVSSGITRRPRSPASIPAGDANKSRYFIKNPNGSFKLVGVTSRRC